MIRTLRVLQPADIEMQAAIKAYDALRPGLGERILSELDDLLGQIALFPESYQKTAHPFRTVEINIIPFKLYYVTSTEGITVTGFVPSRADHKKQRQMLEKRYSLLKN